MNTRARMRFITGLCVILLLVILANLVHAAEVQVRIGEIARIKGDRDNQLLGIGLVVGLAGTGDGSRSQTVSQMLSNMMRNYGVILTPSQINPRNSAVVSVTATLPVSAKPGDRLDVTVSATEGAKSLQGGILMVTPLYGADGRVYAVAQGSVTGVGTGVQARGSSVMEGHPTVGVVPGGAIVEANVEADVEESGYISLVLNNPDYIMAAKVTEVINKVFTEDTATALDKAEVRVQIPPAFRDNTVLFIAELLQLPITPDAIGRVVINSRTGTVVIDGNVRIGKVAVSHGNMKVTVTTTRTVSQPLPLSEGTTQVVEQAQIEVTEGTGNTFVVEALTDVHQLVDALNLIGASTSDVIAILQEIKAAGALYGELIVR